PSTKTLAIVGDLMRGGILFNKKPHYPFFVSDILMLRESIRRIMKLSPEIIYPSHGRPFSPVDVKNLL
ncbi:MAG: hypothetical protein Q8N09_03435, partial [Thermodesulfovibrionia bacterium]|nr:hypothetical protein [Thermodesulfovibrionia bacterium]